MELRRAQCLGLGAFFTYICDIDASTDSVISCFADDMRVMKAVSGPSDVSALQKDLESVYRWMNDNNMLFNNDKFQMLKYSNLPVDKVASQYIFPDSSIIESVNKLKDLEVIMPCSGKFNDQIERVVKKTKQMMEWMLRTFKTRDTRPMLTLYKAIIFP